MKYALIAMMVAASFATSAAQAQESANNTPATSGNFYTGDTKVDMINRYTGAATLSQPEQVLIHDFTYSDDDVTMDNSHAARLHRRLMSQFGKDDDSTEAVLAKTVQTAFSDALTSELKKLNLPAQNAAGVAATGKGVNLVVEGEFVEINEGNEAKRVLIGLGRGRSDIKAHITISSVGEGGSTVVLDFNIDSESKKMPGAVITSGGSLAVGSAENAFGDRKSKVGADATRMGTMVAKQIAGLMKDQKWAYAPSASAATAVLALNK